MVYGEDLIVDDMASLSQDIATILDDLSVIGLGKNEAKVYLTLIITSNGTIESIQNITGLPRTTTYRALKELESRGYIEALEGRPTIYVPVDLERLRKDIIDKINEIFDFLAGLRELTGENLEDKIVIMDTERGLSYIRESIRTARSEVIISAPSLNILRGALRQDLKNLVSRGVNVIIITSRGQRPLPHTEIVWCKDLKTVDIIIDSTKLITSDNDCKKWNITTNRGLAGRIKDMVLKCREES